MFKKIDLKIILLSWVCVFAAPLFCSANTDTFPAFSSSGFLKDDGSLIVSEEFIFDFGEIPRHGLFRSIPLVSDNGKRWFEIKSISVKDKNKNDINVEPNTTGNIAKLKIGNERITLTGTQYYNLRYSISNIASDTELNWTIMNPTREPIGKFQAKLYFPALLPLDVSTSTCELIPKPQEGACLPTPIIKSGKLAGYVINLNGINKEEIFLNVKYPRGIVVSNYVEETSKVPYKKIILWSIFTIVIALLIFFGYKFRNKIKHIFKEISKHSISPDAYSYLERAMYYNKTITKDDIVATIIDLEERGYIELNQFARPVGEHEFIDYSLILLSNDIDNLGEKYLLDSFGETIESLSEWLSITGFLSMI